VLIDQSLRDRMKERSYKQAAKFSWEKSVRRIIDVYHQVGGSPGNRQFQSATDKSTETTGVV
jgi:hypothetical protein